LSWLSTYYLQYLKRSQHGNKKRRKGTALPFKVPINPSIQIGAADLKGTAKAMSRQFARFHRIAQTLFGDAGQKPWAFC